MHMGNLPLKKYIRNKLIEHFESTIVKPQELSKTWLWSSNYQFHA